MKLVLKGEDEIELSTKTDSSTPINKDLVHLLTESTKLWKLLQEKGAITTESGTKAPGISGLLAKVRDLIKQSEAGEFDVLNVSVYIKIETFKEAEVESSGGSDDSGAEDFI